jgi:hypothetical protein
LALSKSLLETDLDAKKKLEVLSRYKKARAKIVCLFLVFILNEIICFNVILFSNLIKSDTYLFLIQALEQIK